MTTSSLWSSPGVHTLLSKWNRSAGRHDCERCAKRRPGDRLHVKQRRRWWQEPGCPRRRKAPPQLTATGALRSAPLPSTTGRERSWAPAGRVVGQACTISWPMVTTEPQLLKRGWKAGLERAICVDVNLEQQSPWVRNLRTRPDALRRAPEQMLGPHAGSGCALAPLQLPALGGAQKDWPQGVSVWTLSCSLEDGRPGGRGPRRV